MLWPVTQKPFDGLNILTKKGKENVSIATLIARMNAQYEKHFENRVRKVAIL